MSTTQSTRTQSARFEPLSADLIAPGMFEVTNLRSGGEYIVDIREPACQCRDYEFRMGPANGKCKHIRFVEQIADGVLCPECGYEVCRPSCPERPTTTEET